MKARAVSLVLALAILTAPLSAQSQQTGKVYRIGFLHANSLPFAAEVVESFRQGLRELGYVEGQNIVIEFRWAHGQRERLKQLAAELVELKVDLILAPHMEPISAAAQATAVIPIVMVFGLDPVGQGLIKSFAKPGRNVTGLAWGPSPEIAGKYVEFLKEIVPKLQRVANLLDRDHPGLAPYTRAFEDIARKLGLRFLRIEVRSPADFEDAFGTMARQRVQGFMVLGSPMMFRHIREIIDLAAKHRLPAIYIERSAVALGGLISYGFDPRDAYRRAAAHVVKLVNGASAAELPVEEPTKYELAVNLKTAKSLGLTVPRSLLLRADHVIE